MNILSIPVRTIGPGSQPDDEPMDMLPMPTGMSVFQMPRLPEAADPAAMARARDALADLHAQFATCTGNGSGHPLIDVARFEPGALRLLNEVLGEGEVAIRVKGETDTRIQESVFAGIWRVQRFDPDGELASDRIEACAIPEIVVAGARQGATGMCAVDFPPGAMNSPALCAELRGYIRRFRPERPPHVLNLTLLPLSPEDHQVLTQALPVGPVAIMSRGFGNCRITSTSAPNVWRVQYFNNMQTLILNTIEVVEVPETAIAARDDLADSRERLGELIEWMSAECAV